MLHVKQANIRCVPDAQGTHVLHIDLAPQEGCQPDHGGIRPLGSMLGQGQSTLRDRGLTTNRLGARGGFGGSAWSSVTLAKKLAIAVLEFAFCDACSSCSFGRSSAIRMRIGSNCRLRRNEELARVDEIVMDLTLSATTRPSPVLERIHFDQRQLQRSAPDFRPSHPPASVPSSFLWPSRTVAALRKCRPKIRLRRARRPLPALVRSLKREPFPPSQGSRCGKDCRLVSVLYVLELCCPSDRGREGRCL